MQLRLANAEAQEDCLNLLALLARDSTGTETVVLMGQSGGLHAVETTQTQKEHPTNDSVKTAALGLLFSIARASVEQLLQGNRMQLFKESPGAEPASNTDPLQE
jgi:hypothetical protein